MKKFLLIITATVILGFYLNTTLVHGAGAVAARKKRAAMQGGIPPEVQQQIQQQLQQQLQDQGVRQQLEQQVRQKVGSQPNQGQPHMTLNLKSIDQPAAPQATQPQAAPQPVPQVLTSSGPQAGYPQIAQNNFAFDPSQGGEIEFDDLMTLLRVSSEIWEQVVDQEVKVMIVAKYVELYRQNRIVITKPSAYYVMRIDQLAQENPTLLNNPFDKVLLIAAVMDYDFNNGTNKDSLAYQVLGPQLYQQNKQRLGMK
ncbi:MAG TPA: hypothetical protein PL155_09060 [Candidatus Omnitrophota bacterium]|nr:hypothetical protein [Candidatus Omnitrophota bacterium]HPD85395.1 hypothetical protein [Candidatus Omnitrophota bacterium]HRZ04104.1 hypothetical protein [Candidatus Omnitrophota bacterium]